MQSNANSRTFSPLATAAAFPLGGIGTGNVSLGARGELRDWEIFNHPGKGTLLPNTFFALWTQAGNQPSVCKILEGPIQPPHNLSHGYHPTTAAGLPRLQNATFRGEYPFATIAFEDSELPVKVEMEGFTPLIPLQTEDSGLPCAILTYTITNTSDTVVSLSLAGSLINPVGGLAFDPFGNMSAGGLGQNFNEQREEGSIKGLYLGSHKYAPEHRLYGNLSLVSTHPHITTKRAWLRGAWFDFLQEFWTDFSTDGQLTDLNYGTPSAEGQTDTASLNLTDVLQPGQTGTYRFILSWYFPNHPKSWNKDSEKLTRNHYALKFDSSWAVAQYVISNLDYLETKTRAFHTALFESTLPPYVLDVISANIVPIRSTTCFWLEDGNFYGYEGCFDDSGSCDGTCTHVWSYAQTAAFLFPELERNMRRTEFVIETEADGYMNFRTYKPFNEPFIWPWGDQKPEAAVDGQMGSILRVLREWQLSGDMDWLREVWPGVKRAIAFASTHWDTDKDGVLDGRQHNTYDIEFYGPNPLCSVYYLAALRAVEELAKVMNECDLAEKYRTLFEDGSKKVDSLLWNGEYYIQKLDQVNAYKYQHGTGCLSDQLLGQLHARILDLGDLLPVEHVHSAIKAVFDNNFMRNFRDHVNCQRTYVLNDEAGLLLCSWPHGDKPFLPFVYSDEVWTGIEYQVAAHLIYEGLSEDGLEIVQAIHARHDGVKRNPWDEVECGHHYARSMASWSLLLALSGYHYNAADAHISFAPQLNTVDFRCFFSTGNCWGTYHQQIIGKQICVQLELEFGFLRLEWLALMSKIMLGAAVEVTHNGIALSTTQSTASRAGIVLAFQMPLTLSEHDVLSAKFDIGSPF